MNNFKRHAESIKNDGGRKVIIGKGVICNTSKPVVHDIEGKKITKKYSGFAARIFQHEYDNMEGTNFTKKVSWVRFDMALKRRKKMVRRARQAAKQLT